MHRELTPLVLSVNVDSVSVLDSTPEAGMPEALKSSESDTTKRRVESSAEREILEIDVGILCRDSSV